MRKNYKALLHVVAAASAFAGVRDRIRFEALPPDATESALCHQAASMALSLSAITHPWDLFHAQLSDDDSLRSIFGALGIIREAKWQS